MKEKRHLLAGIILGVLISWGIVFFSIPYIIRKFSFLMGFVASLAFVSGLLLLFLVWDRQSVKTILFGSKSVTGATANIGRTNILVKLFMTVFIGLAILLSSFYIFQKKEMAIAQKEYQTALLESTRNSEQVALMGNILNAVDDELKNNPERKLSSELIERIAALSYSFKPYRSDELTTEKLSPERGQLLLALAKMNLDTQTFTQIKFKTTFEFANLKGAALRSANLSGVNLKGANLKDADLRGVDLSHANLWDATLWGANLTNANLSSTNFKRANIEWAEMRNAKMAGTNFKGANLSHSNLRQTDLSESDIRLAFLNGTFLNGANLVGVDLSGTSMKRANLANADLRRGDLRWIDFEEANLSFAKLSNTDFKGANLVGADLSGVDLSESLLYRITVNDPNWFETLRNSQVIGIENIHEKFKIEKDVEGVAKYRIARVK